MIIFNNIHITKTHLVYVVQCTFQKAKKLPTVLHLFLLHIPVCLHVPVCLHIPVCLQVPVCLHGEAEEAGELLHHSLTTGGKLRPAGRRQVMKYLEWRLPPPPQPSPPPPPTTTTTTTTTTTIPLLLPPSPHIQQHRPTAQPLLTNDLWQHDVISMAGGW